MGLDLKERQSTLNLAAIHKLAAQVKA